MRPPTRCYVWCTVWGGCSYAYNSEYTYSMTNPTCTLPAPCTLHPILYPIATPYTCICAYHYASLYSVSTYGPAHVHALHTATGMCPIAPTTAAYVSHNLHTEVCTRHARAAHQVRCCAPRTYIPIHRDYTYAQVA